MKKNNKNLTMKVLQAVALGSCLIGGGPAEAADIVPVNPDGNTIAVEKAAENHIKYVITHDGTTEKEETLSGDTIDGEIMGGLADGITAVTGNSVIISGGKLLGEVNGGYTDGSGTAGGNRVIISDGTLYADIIGGESENGNVTGNIVEISGGDIIGEVYGGAGSGDGDIRDNIVSIGGNAVTKELVFGGATEGSGDVIGNMISVSDNAVINNTIYGGGTTGDGDVKNNTVTISGGKLPVDVYGGATEGDGDVTGNKVIVNGGVIDGCISAGESRKNGDVLGNIVEISGGELRGEVNGGYTDGSGTAGGNRVIISDGTLYADIVGGGSANGNVTGNIVEISGGDIIGEVYGGAGSGDGDIRDNIVSIGGNAVTKELVFGGATEGSGDVIGNMISVSDNAVINNTIYGGGTVSEGDVKNNTVTISGGKLPADVYGGATEGDGDISGNKVIISGGAVNGDICGGYANGEGDVGGNKVIISGGTVNGNICGGWGEKNGAVTGNNVSIWGPVVLKNVIGGISNGGKVRGNTLTVCSTGVRAEGISGFQNLEFAVPADAAAGDTMLTISGGQTTDIRGTADNKTTIRAGVMAGSGLKINDTVNLLNNTAGITDINDANNYVDTTGRLIEGVSSDYKLSISQTTDEKHSTIYATITDVPKKLKEQTKLITETRAAGLATLNGGYDLIIGKGLLSAMAVGEKSGFAPFAALNGSKMRYNTGSHVDINGWGINVGLARKLTGKSGTLTIAPLLEYGRGNYASYLDDNTNSRGDGNSQFFGLGCLVRKDNKCGLYGEASIRFGRLKSTFNGTVDNIYTDYKTESNYFAAHAGIGKVFRQKNNCQWDVYGRFFWAHQGGDTARLSSGENYRFDSLNSSRLRIGTRWTKNIGKAQAFYAGAAWEYEFSGKARASWNGRGTPSPSLKGSSGLIELGWQSKSTKKNPLSVDLGLTGWAGKRRGVQLNAAFNWEF